jgi:succinoglycan biosynthesis protein ExoA
MRFSYRVRPSIRALFRQYVRYGRARVAVVRLHPRFFRVKHAAPATLVVGLAGSVLLALTPSWRWLGAAIWIGYLAPLSIGGSVLAVRARFGRPDLVGLSLLALHLGYGLGSLGGLLDGSAKGMQRRGGPPRAEPERDGPGDEPRPQHTKR